MKKSYNEQVGWKPYLMSFTEEAENSSLPLNKNNNNVTNCLVLRRALPFFKWGALFAKRCCVTSQTGEFIAGSGAWDGRGPPGKATGRGGNASAWPGVGGGGCSGRAHPPAQQVCGRSRDVWETALKLPVVTCKSLECSCLGPTFWPRGPLYALGLPWVWGY